MKFFTKTIEVRDPYGTRGASISKTVPRWGVIAAASPFAITILGAAYGFWFIVPEGHVGIVTRFAKAVDQTGAGLNFKVPFIDGVKRVEIREKKSVEKLSAATKNQLPAIATVSINWTVKSESARSLYVRYGSLDQFENRILDPKLRQASKAAISRFNADELIRDRNKAIAKIQEYMTESLAAYPVIINSPQIENIELPPTYMEAILEKEKAREAASREEYKLKQQDLKARQLVQTANSERDAEKARADGKAYRVKVEAIAEAEAIRAKGNAEAEAVKAVQEAIAQNPLLVDYQKAKTWDGKLPTTMMGQGSNILWSMKK